MMISFMANYIFFQPVSQDIPTQTSGNPRKGILRMHAFIGIFVVCFQKKKLNSLSKIFFFARSFEDACKGRVCLHAFMGVFSGRS